jgi:hypothetical protein
VGGNEILPRSRLASLRCRSNAVASQNVPLRLIRQAVTQVGQCSDDAVISPASILARHSHHQRLHVRSNSGTARIPFGVWTIEFLGDGPTVPGQDGVRLGNAATSLSALRPTRLPISSPLQNPHNFPARLLHPLGQQTEWHVAVTLLVTYQDCREYTQTVLAEVASEIAGHRRKVRAHDQPQVWSALRLGAHYSLEPVERHLGIIAQKTALYPAASRAVRVSLSRSMKLAEASRAQGVGYTTSPSRSTGS